MKYFFYYLLLILISIKIFIAKIEGEEMFPNNENFNVFKYSEQFENKTLIIYKLTDYVLNDLLGKNVKNQIVNKNKLSDFLVKLAKEYNSNSYPEINPYHNLFHATEVVQNIYIYLSKSKKNLPLLFTDTYVKENEELEFISNIKYNDLDIFALIISAACHDFKHTGRDNNFYLTYKDKVPFAKILKDYEYKLEYYHFAEAKKLIESMDLLESLNKYQKERFYKIMKLVIYGTDNSLNKKHAEDMILYKEIIKSNDIKLNNQTIDDIKLMIFDCFLHGADISGSTKNFDYFITWADKVLIEFCEQSKEVHSLDETKQINCVGNDDKKFRENELSFFSNVVNIFFEPFCEVFEYLNYLCIQHEYNKKYLLENEVIHK